MQYPLPTFLLLFITFIIYFAYKNSVITKKQLEKRNAFWDREKQANFSRKQPLNDLNFIEIDKGKLPFDSINLSKTELNEIQTKIKEIINLPMVNLKSYTNTDLKLKYGVANLELLSTYESNYIQFSQLLYEWGMYLVKLNQLDKAISVLNYGVLIGTEHSEHIILLGTLYKKTGQLAQLNQLIQYVSKLDSLLKNKIIKRLKSLT